MADFKKYTVQFNIAVRNIQDLYNLSSKLSQEKCVEGLDKQRFLVRYKDLPINKQSLDNSFTNIIVNLDTDEKQRNDFDAKYVQLQDMFYSVQVLHSVICKDNAGFGGGSKSTDFHLPKKNLPNFSGIHIEWPNFISIYNSLIHNNNNLNSVEKMHYLLSVLDREPLTLVKHLVISSDNYEVAYKILTERYENKRMIADKHVEALLSLPILKQVNSKTLGKFVNTLKENTQALKSLKFNVDQWCFLLLHIVLKKLSVELRTKFESTIDSVDIPTFNSLLKFLENQLRIIDNVSGCHLKPSAGNSLIIIDNNKINLSSCPCCKEAHAIYYCSKFDNMTPMQRKAFVIEHKLCFNCLRTHHIQKCTSRSVCQVCRGKHHTKLHIPTSQHSVIKPISSVSSNVSEVTVQPQSLHGFDGKSTMILGTALVNVQDNDGYFHSARALIDSGSQVSIISENLAQKLRLPRTRSGTILGIGASSANETRGVITCSIKTKSKILASEFIILKRITSQLPSVHVDPEVLKQCDNLILADKNFTVPGQIDLLLGVELYDQIFDGRRFSLGDNMPTAYSTAFGWVIMGKAPAASPHSLCVVSMACTSDLNLALSRFWEAEEPPNQPIQDPENIQCEKHFANTYSRDDQGRFIVRLPFKVNQQSLGDSHHTALKRFHNLERRLIGDARLRELYVAFMRDYEQSGLMREVSCPVTKDRYYIPHHGVLKEHSSTTKLRAVFDASATSSNGIPLNQILMPGPILQQNVEDIILRFRLHFVVFTCDVKQMYRQLRMHDDDCRYQTIFWRESPNEPLKQFELTTVTYGVSSSAFQAIRVLHELAHLNAEKYPEVSRVLREDTFVDDVVTGSANLDSAKELQKGLVGVLSQGGFVLRKWSSNSKVFLESLPEDYCETPYRFEAGDNIFKVLGIEWNANSDSFVCHVSEMSKILTKRGILSNIARLYDPCGFLTPVTFLAKLFLQQLWSMESGWDDPLPDDIQRSWIAFMSDFPQLNKVSIPRCVLANQPLDIQLHGFSDASERGYAGCVYLRVLGADGSALVRLLLAKSRVAPLKQKLTIPKMELNGAFLLARLFEHVFNIYSDKFRLDSIVAWTDSSIVLSWLGTSPHKLQTYEGNRVSQIQALVPNAVWRHVPSHMNPADSASRGVSPSDLVNHPLWWRPAWLEEESSTWPETISPVPETELPGVKSATASSFVTARDVEELPLLTNVSSFPKLRNVVAWCKRFLHNTRHPSNRRSGLLTVSELTDSMLSIVSSVQRSEFPDALRLLRANQVVKGTLMRLNPFLDSQGLIRVGGRIHRSDLRYESKHPLLLPKSHHVTHLLVDHYHRMFLHPGLNSLMNLLQRRFWILSARRVIRHRIFRCHRCYRLRPKSIEPFMGDLPADRVTICRPYQKVGVDFAGPFLLKSSPTRNSKTVKSYLCVFVCFATKCVHLELVSDLSTEAFLACLDRFVSRRGLPSDIYSDCGTNFVGARNYLKEITIFFKQSNDEIHKYLINQHVIWHFNPPASPHMGGLWESVVRSAKLILNRVIGERPLVFEELTTVFAKVEAALNSRPICPLSNDPNDLEVLTPGHFIIGQPLQSLPEHTQDSDNISVLKRWQLVRQISQQFWKRWQAEYLHTLQQRPKWHAKPANIQVGDLVLVKEPNLPPLLWKKARVSRVCPGSDGTVRVVELRTATGTLLRPVTKVCPLLPHPQ